MIEVKNLTTAFLKEITLTIPAREISFLFGANGAGKSSLLRVISGLETPTGGSVTKEPSLGLLMQEVDFEIFGGTVLEDILLSLATPSEEDKKKALALAESFGLNPEAHTMRLSYGEKKKLALASLLFKAPETLLFDEPTAALDWPSVLALIEDIRRIREGRTLLIATHDVESFKPLFEEKTEGFVLYKGRLVAAGKIEEIRKSVSSHREWGIKPF